MMLMDGFRPKSRLSASLDLLKSLPFVPRSSGQPRGTSTIDPVLGRIGNLEVRLVTTKAELKEAQRLRYSVFYKEMSAKSGVVAMAKRRDIDPFDRFCDHLIVVDHDERTAANQKSSGRIVGTYRLMRQEVADAHCGFYTQGEYDISALTARHPDKRFLELGRSCVVEAYRTKRTVELLWHGIWAYVLHHKIDVMFGCASLEGTDLEILRDQLSLLSSAKETPDRWQARAHDRHYVSMNATPSAEKMDQRRTLAALPPLIKGYLRLGAYIGDGAVVDHAFGTTDVLIILPIEEINPRYVTYYGDDASRHAA